MYRVVRMWRKDWIVGYGRPPATVNRKGRRWVMLPALLLACLAPQVSDAQVLDIIAIINTAVKKVIVAADLEVERLQTQTMGLQNAEKALENSMDLSELNDIGGWVQAQKDLFAEYYQELWQVKNVLATYEQVKGMIVRQGQIVSGAEQARSILTQDKHFSAAEASQMASVLSGIVAQSEQNLKSLVMVVTALVTQMNDAGRLKIIGEAGRDIDRNYRDLAQYSQESYLLSVQRAKDENDVAATRALYGIGP